MNVYREIMVLAIVGLFIGTGVIPNICGNQIKETKNIVVNSKDNTVATTKILNEIQNTKGKILSIDKMIFDVHVKYYEHYENNALIKNDSILLHINPETNEILLYEKNWDEVSVDTSLFFEEEIKIKNSFWKRLVVFPSQKDCGKFYTISNDLEFPITCWEVRHCNGETILYNEKGEEIGNGIPAPAEGGFSLSGWDDNYGYPWENWRESANQWFRKWCDFTITDKGPSKSVISEHVSNPEIDYFYELAHGSSTVFKPCPNEWYRSYMVSDDIEKRQPMKFAFIGSCGGMDTTSNGSFSHAFRKGEMYGTVTIGYSGMGESPGWSRSLYWQDTLFENMANGQTFKESFDNACLNYPIIVDAVRFKGDENLSIENYPPSQPKINGIHTGEVNTICSFTSSSYDPEADGIYYMVDWGDDSSSTWLGPYSFDEKPLFTHLWSKTGTYEVIFKSKDNTHTNGSESSIDFHVTSAPETPSRPLGRRIGRNETLCRYYTSCVDPDNDTIYLLWSWGDGTDSGWVGPYNSGELCSWTHVWKEEGEYEIKVKAKDEYEVESDWSDTLIISMPKNKVINNPFLQFLENHPFMFPLLQQLLGL